MGEQCCEGVRDGREVWIDGERVKDVIKHPALEPIIDIRSRMHDMQHDNEHASTLTCHDNGSQHSIFNRLPRVQQDWHGKWKAVDTVMKDIGGIVKVSAPGVKMIARSGFAGRASAEDYPLADKFDEVAFLTVLDNVLIPWEDVFLHRHTSQAFHG